MNIEQFLMLVMAVACFMAGLTFPVRERKKFEQLDEWIGSSIAKLSPKPDDVLLVKFPPERYGDRGFVDRIRLIFTGIVPGMKVVVMATDFDLSTMTPDEVMKLLGGHKNGNSDCGGN